MRMNRLTFSDFEVSEGRPAPEATDLIKRACGRHVPPNEMFDARDYPQLRDDWHCGTCFSGIDREEQAAEAAAAMPAPSWAPTCEKGNWVRADRQARLTSCDWTQVADSALTSAKKQEWKDYRQALRDLTDNFVTPDVVVWPVRPT